MTYYLGSRSLRELEGVHPSLCQVVHKAIHISGQDFAVHDGIRTKTEQEEFVRRKVSRTMNSRHLPQEDGHGHAVDLVPYINGQLRWEWPPIYVIAVAVRAAAEELKVPIRWGGCWGRLDFTDEPPERLVQRYVAARRAKGQSAFIDGPHYELLEVR